MIFFTIGTHEPFDRMVRAVDEWAGASGAEVFGQIPEFGETGYVPRHFSHVTLLKPADFEEKVRASDFVVAHAGIGCIISALRNERPVLIMPRRGHLRETRNDHQYATAMRLKDTPGITVAVDENELPHRLDALRATKASPGHISRWAEPRLVETVHRFIHGVS